MACMVKGKFRVVYQGYHVGSHSLAETADRIPISEIESEEIE